ncbi:hypothetical protein ACQ4PT_045555 [Festuca glaucescens]
MTKQRSPKIRRLPSSSPADSVDGDAASVKSVCRFRCVSRGWDALVSDPTFVAVHTSWHPEPLLVTASEPDDQNRWDLRLMDMNGSVLRKTKLAGGTAGLVSASTDNLVCIIDHLYGSALAIDPATRKLLVKCPRMLLDLPITLGFGRAVPSGAYKVVRFANNLTCEIFTLEDDIRWRHAQSPPAYSHDAQGPSVSLNGVMYFLVYPYHDDGKLICFDLETEKWKSTIKGPVEGLKPCKETERICISELNGALCVVGLERLKNGYGCANIWLLSNLDKNTWNKAFTISMEPFTYKFTPLWVTPQPGGGGKLTFFLLKS